MLCTGRSPGQQRGFTPEAMAKGSKEVCVVPDIAVLSLFVGELVINVVVVGCCCVHGDR